MEEAATGFLQYLQKFGESAPNAVRQRQVMKQVRPLVAWLDDRSSAELQKRISEIAKDHDENSIQASIKEIVSGQITLLKRLMRGSADAEFVDGMLPALSNDDKATIRDAVHGGLSLADEEQKIEFIEFIVSNIGRISPLQPATGIVVAGFGRNELFPTLKAYEISGMVGGALKFRSTQNIDIDRNGDRARVIPFAQREMVERFLYGLDSDIERKIRQFCQRTVSDIAQKILERFDLDDEALDDLLGEAQTAERAFLSGLDNEGFNAIRGDSQAEIEDMVEFMPKPEMARMAEALVNLTSIKRRVSRGMETVGGPIDVAVISKAEGFVWVKRKLYFPPELNHRYLNRMPNGTDISRERYDEPNEQI